jgi:hypothetical protein
MSAIARAWSLTRFPLGERVSTGLDVASLPSVIVQGTQCTQNVINRNRLASAGRAPHGRLTFDGGAVGRPGSKDRPFDLGLKLGVLNDIERTTEI